MTSRGFIGSLTELWDYRDLLRELVTREMKLRYRRSVLGFLWSLITPLYQIVGFTFVLHALGNRDANLSFIIMTGLVPWIFLSTGILNSCAAILRYRAVVRKVYFPRQMVVFSSVAANLIHLLLSLAVVLVIFLVRPVIIHPTVWILLPLIVFETLLVAGLGMICCVAHTYYADVEYALGNIMQVAMFINPVLFSMNDKLTAYPAIWQTIYKLNPAAVLIEGWRGALLRNEYPEPFFFAVAAGTSVFVFLLGLWLWRRHEWRFPEVV